MDYAFRKAEIKDVDSIWDVLQQAIVRRKEDGSSQWQDGYPNPEIIQSDLDKEAGFVLCNEDTVIGYCAVLINDEPAYAEIDGRWLTDDGFVAVHRVAISDPYTGKGLAKIILRFVEEYAIGRQIFSIKADTNFDNPAMMRTFEKLGYSYCGEVYFRGGARRAYQKVLKPDFK